MKIAQIFKKGKAKQKSEPGEPASDEAANLEDLGKGPSSGQPMYDEPAHIQQQAATGQQPISDDPVDADYDEEDDRLR